MSFLQSAEFGEFQKKIPYRGKSWRLACHPGLDPGSIDSRFCGNDKNRDGEESCLVVRMKLPLGLCWLWIPYGPKSMDGRVWTGEYGGSMEIFKELEKIAKKERAVFTRIEPPQNFPALETLGLEKKWRIEKSFKRYTPEASLVLDLEKSEEQILAQMKPKGRYNIRVAQKNGVTIQKFSGADMLQQAQHDSIAYGQADDVNRCQADDVNRCQAEPVEAFSKSIDGFYEILKKTGERDSFRIHPKYFYENLLKTFGDQALLYLAFAPKVTAGGNLEHKKAISQIPAQGFAAGNDPFLIAGIIVIFHKDTATYYYGASDHAHRNLMAPYLLQWEAICEAKRRGMKIYDFFGIAPTQDALRQAQGDNVMVSLSDHPWAGVTEFKKKFGGLEIQYPPAFDIVYKPFWYSLMKLVKK